MSFSLCGAGGWVLVYGGGWWVGFSLWWWGWWVGVRLMGQTNLEREREVEAKKNK